MGELAGYDPDLPARVRLVALNKIDLPGAPDTARALAEELESSLIEARQLSALEGTGLEELAAALGVISAGADASAKPVLHVYRPEPVQARIKVEKDEGSFRVRSRAVERIVARADLSNAEALARMRRQLADAGLRQALLDAGAEAGDTIVVGQTEFLFDPEL
jgi:GTP-binding protein